MVCGPTASGKTGLADEVAAWVSDATGTWSPTLVVDSMQVYKEIPIITNQERERPAELTAVVSVAEEWTMARHRFAADEVLASTEGPFVLDAGTGMYLNALLLDIDIAPKVPTGVRWEAENTSHRAVNPRRAVREKELELVGAPGRGSIWSGAPRYDIGLIFLRPDRAVLDPAIALRSGKIAREGVEEAARLKALADQGCGPNPSVRASIGFRELTDHVSGGLTLEEAEALISARTRKLARRQIRWFDKLARVLQEHARVTVARSTRDLPSLNSMFGIIGS